jgi:hypothetical protein
VQEVREALPRSRLDHRDDLLVAEGERRVGEGRVQPAVEAVPAAVDVLVAHQRQSGEQPGQPGVARQHAGPALVVAGLQLLEPAAHLRRPPAAVAGGRSDAVPVGVVRIDGDHRVVRGAAAERARARVEDAVLLGHELLVPLLLGAVVEVADVDGPAHPGVLARAAVEGRHPVVVVLGVESGLQEQHPVAGLGQVRRDRTAAGPGAHDDEVERLRVGWESVGRESIGRESVGRQAHGRLLRAPR